MWNIFGMLASICCFKRGFLLFFFLVLISLMPFFVKYFNFTQSERVTTREKRTRGTRGNPWGTLVGRTTIWIPASATGVHIIPVTKNRSIIGMIINGVRIIWCWPDCKLAVMVTVGVIQRIKKGLRRPGISITYMKARKTDYLTQRKPSFFALSGTTLTLIASTGRT